MIFCSENRFFVDGIAVKRNADEIDQSEDAADAAEQRCQENPGDAALRLAHHKIVDAQSSQKKADEKNDAFVLPIEPGRPERNAAGQAKFAKFNVIRDTGPTIETKRVANAGFAPAFEANGLVVIPWLTTISAIHV